MLRTTIVFLSAAFFEIAGCYAFWAVLRDGRNPWWMAAGVVSLIAFAWALTFAPTDAAGRAYAAYGGIYVAASLIWLRTVEGLEPDRWDLIGAAVAVAGAGIILFAPRG